MKPVVIVGAGPAGLSCAQVLISQGVPVVLLDDNPQAGGQYFRQLPKGYEVASSSGLLRDVSRFGALKAVLGSPLMRYLPNTVAWAASQPLTLAYAGPEGSGRIAARAVVIATGAQDRPFPFTGWTLPGVISAGGALNMVKGHGVVPTGKVVVAGNGPLVLVAAATLVAAGAQVTHVLEAGSQTTLFSAACRGLWRVPSLLLKGLSYRARLMAAGVRFMSNHVIDRADGDAALTGVRVARVGSDGRPDSRQGVSLSSDMLVVGYGLLPGTEFARTVGCSMSHDALLGGLVPRRTKTLETSVPGVYAIGDGAGIGGVELALLEGTLAANAILGSVNLERVQARYRRYNRFRRTLAAAYQLPVVLNAAQGDTMICRCEELRLQELKPFFDPDDLSLGRLKSATRLGMGRCQGRNCLSSATQQFGLLVDDALPRARAPIRPVRINHIIADGDVGAAHEPDENDVLLDNKEPA